MIWVAHLLAGGHARTIAFVGRCRHLPGTVKIVGRLSELALI